MLWDRPIRGIEERINDTATGGASMQRSPLWTPPQRARALEKYNLIHNQLYDYVVASETESNSRDLWNRPADAGIHWLMYAVS